MPLLEVTAIHSFYGPIHAVKGVSLTVNRGEIVTLIGSNGAGKTTTIRTISGVMHARQGQVRLGNEEITRLPAHEVDSPGNIPVTGGPAHLSAHDRPGKPRHGCLSAHRSSRDRGRPRTSARVLSPAPRAPPAGGRHVVRRRAANAGNWSRLDGAPQATSPRRTVDGPLACPGRADSSTSFRRSTGRERRFSWSNRTP